MDIDYDKVAEKQNSSGLFRWQACSLRALADDIEDGLIYENEI